VTFGVLRRTRRRALILPAWGGVGLAVFASATAAAVLIAIGAELEGRSEAMFEGSTMLIAAAVLTWMILWMSQQGRSVQRGIERDVESAAVRQQATAIFAVAFFAVLREGVETALFLTAAAFQDARTSVLVGGLAGIASACILGWGLYRATLRLNLGRFFQFTGILLLFFSAGLVAHGVHEFIEAGWLPALIDPLWTTEAILPESSVLGSLLHTLFGYSAAPTLLEVLAYTAYFSVVVLMIRWFRAREPVAVAAPG
jgi:high-affinity iron transporter